MATRCPRGPGRCWHAAARAPLLSDTASVPYMSCLPQVDWLRVVLDEGEPPSPVPACKLTHVASGHGTPRSLRTPACLQLVPAACCAAAQPARTPARGCSPHHQEPQDSHGQGLPRPQGRPMLGRHRHAAAEFAAGAGSSRGARLGGCRPGEPATGQVVRRLLPQPSTCSHAGRAAYAVPCECALKCCGPVPVQDLHGVCRFLRLEPLDDRSLCALAWASISTLH